MATAIGPSSPPAGSRMSRASASPRRCDTGSEHTVPPVRPAAAARGRRVAPNASAATSGMVAVTRPTRRYCTTATTRSSPPRSRLTATSPDAPPAVSASMPVSGVTPGCRPEQQTRGHADRERPGRDQQDGQPVGGEPAERRRLGEHADDDADHRLGERRRPAGDRGGCAPGQRQRGRDDQTREERGRGEPQQRERDGADGRPDHEQRPPPPLAPAVGHRCAMRARTAAAADVMALSLARAAVAGRCRSPQSGVTSSRSGGTTANARSIRRSTSGTGSTSAVFTSSTPTPSTRSQPCFSISARSS